MIFLDNASTTKPDEEILNNFLDYQKYYFNPSSGYNVSVDETNLINNARKEILGCLNKTSGEFVFTGSSSEANNIIINSFVNNNKNSEYIFSSIEHPSVYNLAVKLLNEGKIVHFVPLDSNGKVDEEALIDLINENTKFVSIIHVCNETGMINDINDLAKKVKEKNNSVIFHSDGVQAFCKIETKLNDFVDAYTISSHKIHGLKGIAGFYVKDLSKLKTFIFGGGQEFNIRSGTTNAPLILSFRDACSCGIENLKTNFEHVKKLQQVLIDNLKDEKNISFNTNFDYASPYIVSLSVLRLNAETIMNILSEKQIFVGLGSACSTRKAGNRVLENMHKSKSEILGNIRVSFSKFNTENEVLTFTNELKSTIEFLTEKLK